MKRTITIEGRRYLIRGPYGARDLRRLYSAFVNKFGPVMTFKQWAIDRGKVYFAIDRQGESQMKIKHHGERIKVPFDAAAGVNPGPLFDVTADQEDAIPVLKRRITATQVFVANMKKANKIIKAKYLNRDEKAAAIKKLLDLSDRMARLFADGAPRPPFEIPVIAGAERAIKRMKGQVKIIEGDATLCWECGAKLGAHEGHCPFHPFNRK
jgi:hypothetical protein